MTKADEPVTDYNDLEREAVQYCFDAGYNLTPRVATDIAKHFYELGQHGKAMLHVADKSYQMGRRDERMELMKDAVEGTLGYGPHLQRPIIFLEKVPEIWNGSTQPVKIIIVKEDEK